MRVHVLAAAIAANVVASMACSAGNEKDGSPSATLGADTGAGGGDGGLAPGFDANDPDAAYDPDAACAAKSFLGAKLPLHVSLVFDVSSSMTSKIATARAGMKEAFTDPRFDDVSVTLFRFGLPGFGADHDKTPFAGPVFLDATGEPKVLSAIDALSPAGSTPLSSGLTSAYQWLWDHGVKDAKAPWFEGKTVVVAVSDGIPSALSMDVSDYVSLVKKARAEKGIDTFVIGTPGASEVGTDGALDGVHGTALLSSMAGAGTDPANLPSGCNPTPSPKSACTGGCACFYDLTSGFSGKALAGVLDSIRKLSNACVYALPPLDPKYDAANPDVNLVEPGGAAKKLPKCADPSAPPAGGCWTWEKEGESVKLHGAACQAVKDDETIRVDILLACKVR